MTDDLFTWLFWCGAAGILYCAIAGFVRYVQHSRRGAAILAAQAMVQTVLSMFGLVALWLIHRYNMPV